MASSLKKYTRLSPWTEVASRPIKTVSREWEVKAERNTAGKVIFYLPEVHQEGKPVPEVPKKAVPEKAIFTI